MNVISLLLSALFMMAHRAIADDEKVALTTLNFDSLTAGKTIFILCYSPNNENSQLIMHDWERIEHDFEGREGAWVGMVDCTTTDGVELCDTLDVMVYPTILWGDTHGSLDIYDGGQTYDEMAAFAAEHLKPMCSLSHMDLCDEQMKASIAAYQEMSVEELEAKLDDVQTKLEDLEIEFEEDLTLLSEKYEKLMQDNGDGDGGDGEKSQEAIDVEVEVAEMTKDLEHKEHMIKNQGHYGIVSAILQMKLDSEKEEL